MRMQSSQANCGPTSLYNAACALGRKVTLEECEKACRTTATEGTTPRKLKAGAKALGFYVAQEVREGREDIAPLVLTSALRLGQVAIITVDADSHWIAVVGRVGQRYLIADSADNELVMGYSEGELLQRWRNPESRKGFYALVVS